MWQLTVVFLYIFWFRWMASLSFPRFSFFESSNTMNLPLPPVMLKVFSFVQTNVAMISPERAVDYMSNSLALRADHARFFLCILSGMIHFQFANLRFHLVILPFVAYPIAFIYHHYISGLTSRTWRLLYTFITGLSLVFWLVGMEILFL